MDYLNFMKNFPEDISKIKTRIPKLLAILITLLLITGIYIFMYNNNMYYVIIRFNELGALAKNMPAYYNGFRIGKVVDIEPDKDFKHTLVRVNLIRNNINLPQNTTVKVENFPNGELYLQFMYPESPSLKTIKRGDMLEGIAPYSLEQFMLGQNISGVTDIVTLHVIQALRATEIANLEIREFFKNTSTLVEENRAGISTSVNNISAMTKSLAQMAENLNQSSRKINNALDEKTLKNTTSNIKDSTDNISKATKDIGKTMKKVDDTIFQVNATAQNLNSITSGLNETLSKKFGGMRVMFGTTVKQKNCCRNACH